MKYFKNNETSEVFAYDETYANDLPYIQSAIDKGWEDITDSWPPPVSESNRVELALAACKADAKQKLLDTDYTQLADVYSNLTNKAEFDAFRFEVRKLYLDPVENPIWPPEPTPIWKS